VGFKSFKKAGWKPALLGAKGLSGVQKGFKEFKGGEKRLLRSSQ
jgi:hypothetical protein